MLHMLRVQLCKHPPLCTCHKLKLNPLLSVLRCTMPAAPALIPCHLFPHCITCTLWAFLMLPSHPCALFCTHKLSFSDR